MLAVIKVVEFGRLRSARADGGARLNDIMSLGFTNMTLKFLDTQPLHFDYTFMVRGVYSLQ